MEAQVTQEGIEKFKSILLRKGREPATVSQYVRSLDKLVLYLNGECLSRERMKGFGDWLLDMEYKQRTVNSYLNTANQYCIIMGWDDMTVPLLRLEQDNFIEEKYISSRDYRKLVTAAMAHQQYDMAMAIQVLCHTYLRFCELEKLTVEVLPYAEIHVDRAGRHRTIYIPNILNEDLAFYVREQGIETGVIFRTRTGNAVDRTNFWKKLKGLCCQVGVDAGRISVNRLKKPPVRDYYPYYPLDMFASAE